MKIPYVYSANVIDLRDDGRLVVDIDLGFGLRRTEAMKFNLVSLAPLNKSNERAYQYIKDMVLNRTVKITVYETGDKEYAAEVTFVHGKTEFNLIDQLLMLRFVFISLQ